jgi:osmotically inducible protein OsmC
MLTSHPGNLIVQEDVGIYKEVDMAIRSAQANWQGTLKEGQGNMKLGSGAFEGAFSFASRFEDGDGTNPEELIGAAHAGCFSMALSADLERAGYPAKRVHTQAKVHLGRVEGKMRITLIELNTEAEVPGISEVEFSDIAQGAKVGCPVSAALSAVEIELKAHLL